MTIFTIVLVTAASMLDSTMNQLKLAESRFSQFREAQAAFESMNLRLAGCELTPYYDYSYPNGNTALVPTSYQLSSDLHFVCGPVSMGARPLLVPAGGRVTHGVFFHGAYGISDEPGWHDLRQLMNSWGYYVEFGSDQNDRAEFLNTAATGQRFRFRLKELQVPAEATRTYALRLNKSRITIDYLYDWFRTPANNPQFSRTVAENIIAMVVTPLRPDALGTVSSDLAPAYIFDSRGYQYVADSVTLRNRHKLPPLVRITLVALDENSAARLQDKHGSSMPSFDLDKLFTTPSRYDQDLAQLEATLQGEKLRYRVFTNTVRLRNSRWTSSY